MVHMPHDALVLRMHCAGMTQGRCLSQACVCVCVTRHRDFNAFYDLYQQWKGSATTEKSVRGLIHALQKNRYR